MPHWCRQRQQAAAGDAHVRRERESERVSEGEEKDGMLCLCGACFIVQLASITAAAAASKQDCAAAAAGLLRAQTGEREARVALFGMTG
jgi:hypothetical protein